MNGYDAESLGIDARSPSRGHSVAVIVLDARRFRRRYAAACSCGWAGRVRRLHRMARRDVTDHTVVILWENARAFE